MPGPGGSAHSGLYLPRAGRPWRAGRLAATLGAGDQVAAIREGSAHHAGKRASGGILGLSTLIPGVVLLAHNGSSRVDQAGVAERREPLFQAAPQLAAAPSFRVPLLTFAF